MRQDVGQMESPGAQPPNGVIDDAGERDEWPVIATPGQALIFQLKTRLGKKRRDIAPVPDEMVLDDQHIVIPDKIVLQCVQVNRERDNQENNVRRDRPQGLPGTRRFSSNLGLSFVHGVKKRFNNPAANSSPSRPGAGCRVQAVIYDVRLKWRMQGRQIARQGNRE